MLAIAILISAVVTLVCAESHSIYLHNYCGHGEAVVVIDGKVVLEVDGTTSIGPWTTNVPKSGIAYLQDGNCALNGEPCTLVEWTLSNLGTGVGISLIPPHAFNAGVYFSFDHCNYIGRACRTADCTTAFHSSSDTGKIITCEADDVELAITFCPPSEFGYIGV